MERRHYEFTGETTNHEGHTLHRIRATRDLPQHGVNKGDLGGWIEHTGNLNGNAWVANEAKVFGDARLFDVALVYGTAEISGNTFVGEEAKVGGSTTIEHGVISNNSIVESNNDYLEVLTSTSNPLYVTLTRTQSGHHIFAGGWEGTIEELESGFEQKDWAFETFSEDVERMRPEMLAMCAMFRARIESWQN